jgi:hypothetical protein
MKNQSGLKKVNILNTEIDNLSMTELLEKLEFGIVFTPNVDHIIKRICSNGLLLEVVLCELCPGKLLKTL